MNSIIQNKTPQKNLFTKHKSYEEIIYLTTQLKLKILDLKRLNKKRITPKNNTRETLKFSNSETFKKLDLKNENKKL